MRRVYVTEILGLMVKDMENRLVRYIWNCYFTNFIDVLADQN